MSLFKTVFGWNYMLMVSASSWAVAQVVKMLINFAVTKEWSVERLFGDGGMPSAHSATVSSLAVAAGRYCGIGSPVFAVTTMFAIVVMHDAMGVRWETGKQAKVLNQMLQEWMALGAKYNPLLDNKRLKEMVGHTPLQVIFGALLGICMGFIIPMV